MQFFIIPVILATLIAGISAVSVSDLPKQVVGTVGGSVRISAGRLSNATNDTLSWMMGNTYLVNATVRSYAGKASVTQIRNLNDSLYVGSFVATGPDVTTNLTLKALTMTLNGTMIKLKHGSAVSAVSTIVIVKEIVETTTVATEEPTTEGMTSPDTMTTSLDSTAIPTSLLTSSGDKATDTPTESTGSTTTTSGAIDTSGTTVTPEVACNGTGFGAPPNGTNCTQVGCEITLDDQDTVSSYAGSGRRCTATYNCNADGNWTRVESDVKCVVPGTWGPDCTRACGNGCHETNGSRYCDMDTGKCTTADGSAQEGCADGYEWDSLCNTPKCEDCNGGECLSPGFCGNCPLHYEHGPTCRNIRLDGFVKGSIPSLIILAAVVILLTAISKWHIKRKIKEA